MSPIVSVTTSPGVLAPANSQRKELFITNEGTTDQIARVDDSPNDVQSSSLIIYNRDSIVLRGARARAACYGIADATVNLSFTEVF